MFGKRLMGLAGFWVFVTLQTGCAARRFEPAASTVQGAPLNPRESAGNAICFFPGAKGGGSVINSQLPARLKARGIPFIPMKTGKKGTVQQRAEHVQVQMQELVQKNPQLRCHFMGHSLGGLTSRYSLNHIYIDHPQLGHIPLSGIGASLTMLQAAIDGNPVADISRFLDLNKKTVSSTQQTSYGLIRIFNDPKFPKTYSPLPKEFPVYSYRTYITSQFEMLARPEAALLSYLVIKKIESQAGRDPRNDGTIPLQSQTAGLIIGDLHAPHGYFSAPKTWVKTDVADFFQWHWNFLTSTDANRLAVVQAQLLKSGLSRPKDIPLDDDTKVSTPTPSPVQGNDDDGDEGEFNPPPGALEQVQSANEGNAVLPK